MARPPKAPGRVEVEGLNVHRSKAEMAHRQRAPKLEHGEPPMPADLTPEEQAHWHQQARILMDMNVLSPSHVSLLRLLAESLARHDYLQKRIRRNGGWYHSHTRSEVLLSLQDCEAHDRYFPGRRQVALVDQLQVMAWAGAVEVGLALVARRQVDLAHLPPVFARASSTRAHR